uniref:Peptidase M3A/M3B catalytic domain-containing protein n=1 Tax=Strigamia maritima TaxID=126957 RepID=T1IK18_STRMM
MTLLKFSQLVIRISFKSIQFYHRQRTLTTGQKLLKMSKISGIKCCWNFDALTEAEISNKTDELIEKCRLSYNQVADLKFEDVAYDNVIKKLADIECDFLTYSSPLEFPKQVSTIKEIRNASTAAAQKLQDFDVEMSMRKDIYDKVEYFQEKNKFKMHTLDPEAKRYVERLIKLGRRNGLHLPYETQVQVKAIKKKMSELCISFQQNMNEENTVLEYTEKQLQGLPDDFIQSLEKLENGKRKVTLKYPHSLPIMRKCQNSYTRNELDQALNSQCIQENGPILEELVALRQKQADLLGYQNHSMFITEMRMAKSAENVSNFLNDLKDRLQPLWSKEREQMLKLKEEECKALGVRFDGKLNHWDLRYYVSMIEEKLFAVDQNKLKEYFPLGVVTGGLLKIYQELLGVRFEEVKDGDIWHSDVQLFRAIDVETKELLGYFYLDLFPREGKYGHAAAFKLQSGCIGPDNQKQLPVIAMLTNFTRPTEDKPALLDHKEVETYFHEFGHVMHHICARAKFIIFSGTKVERDFVEAPSQMLENWVWELEPLKRMSAHYKTKEPIPEEMIQKLVASQKANAGIFNLRQIVLAEFDQMIHTRGEANTQQIFNQVFEKIIGIPTIERTNMSASFTHLAGGYDAQYYGYLASCWSEVFSADMFLTRFKKEGIMNPSVGKDYRKCILEPGGSLDADIMLEKFLGRKPNQNAFLKSKGIDLV